MNDRLNRDNCSDICCRRACVNRIAWRGWVGLVLPILFSAFPPSAPLVHGAIWQEASSNRTAVGVTAEEKKAVREKTMDAQSITPKNSSAARHQANFRRREKLVTDFVQQHQPELDSLLQSLKLKHPREYRGAINRTAKNVNRIKGLQRRKSAKYPLALKHWQLKSQLEVVAARLPFEDNDQTRQKLKSLVNQIVDARKTLLEMEAQELEKRLAQVNSALTKIEEKRDVIIKRHIRSVEKAAKQIGAGGEIKKQQGD